MKAQFFVMILSELPNDFFSSMINNFHLIRHTDLWGSLGFAGGHYISLSRASS